MDNRNRISLTLGDSEFSQVQAVSEILGVKPTRVVYECLRAGLPGVLASGQRLKADVDLAFILKQQVDFEVAKKKSRTNTQKKQDAKNKK